MNSCRGEQSFSHPRAAKLDARHRLGRNFMAIYKQKGSKNWWYKFNWNGELIRESTKQANKRVAEQMEAAHRASLAKGDVGIREKKPVPTVKEFVEQDFLPSRDLSKSQRRWNTTGTASRTLWVLPPSRHVALMPSLQTRSETSYRNVAPGA